MRARNMQKLTDEIKLRHPGVTIYGIGDDAHKTRISDHNEDDTAGVRAAQSDEDTIPEHRAIDVMLGEHFTKAQAEDLIHDIVANPTNKPRMQYIIFDRKIRRRVDDYVPETYDGEDDHTNHIHISGRAADDENTADWMSGQAAPEPPTRGYELLVVDGDLGPKTIKRWQEVMGTKADGVISENSQLVTKVQERLKATVNHRLVVDGDGNSLDVGVFRKTVAALQQYLRSPIDGIISRNNSQVIKALQRRLNQNKF